MADIIEIKTYQYYEFASRHTGLKSVAQCHCQTGQIAYLHFIDGDHNLSESKKMGNNNYILYYPYADMAAIIDMLRNEKPIYLIYVPEGTNNCRLSTGSEAVGEGEEHI